MIQRTRVGAYAIVLDEGGTRILLTELAYSASAGRWSLPGGGIEHGETPEEALAREVREEAGIEIASPALFTVFTSRTTWTRDDTEPEDIHYVGIVYRARFAGGTLKDTGDGGSCASARWWALADLASVNLSTVAANVLRKAMLLAPSP